MLRDLTRSDWCELLGFPSDLTPRVLILRGTRNLATNYDIHRHLFTDVVDIGTPNGIIEHFLVGDLGGVRVGYASVYGAPMASELTHLCGILGTELVIQMGNCGGLADEMGPGDLFVAASAYCGEGASQYYCDQKHVEATGSLVEDLSALEPSVCVGKIFTTSALFAESKADLETWTTEGFSAVDMETAATYAVASHFGMQRISILYAFDNPRRGEHILLKDDEADQRRKTGNEKMVNLVVETTKRFTAGS